MKPLNWFFAQLFPSISSVSYGAVTDLCKALARDSSGARKPAAIEEFGFNDDTDRIFCCKPYLWDWCGSTTEVVAWYKQKFAELPEQERHWPNSAPTLVFRRILEKQFFITLDEEGPDDMETSRREYTFLRKEENIPRKRVDSWKHADRPSPGCEGLLSPWTLRCWDHDRIFISRPNSFLGSHRERNQQIRDRNVRRNSCGKRWEQVQGNLSQKLNHDQSRL